MSNSHPEKPESLTPEMTVQESLEKAMRERVAEVMTSSDLADCINVLAKHYHSAKPRLFEQLAIVAKAVEPIDRTLGPDPEYPAANAFLWGEVLAMHLVDDFLGDDRKDIKKVLAELNMALPQDPELVEASAQTIMDMGGKGTRQTDIAQDLIEKAESAVCPDVTQHIYFQHGFGFVVLIAAELKLEIERKRQQEAMQKLIEQAESEGDWDAALQSLLS